MHSMPIPWSYINAENSMINPSTIHIHDTGLAAYFRRYLIQKAISVFKWTIPEHWNRDYFLYCLFYYGYIAIINTDKYGVIPQNCTLSGYGIFYQPTNVLIANPLLRGQLNPRIDIDCTLIKLCPDYGGIYDMISYYADMMALSIETATTNLVNSKLSYVFTAEGKAAAESFKKLYDRVASGEPAVVIDRKLVNPDGTPNWTPFSQNVGQNFIVPELLETLEVWEDRFNTDMGIPNANTQKKERMIVDEVNANNVETSTRCELWLESLQDGCERARKMFGLENLSVDWRVDPNTFLQNNAQVQQGGDK